MERLPYIDEHATVVGAAPDRTWAALLDVCRSVAGAVTPAPLAAVLRPEPGRRSGDWRDAVAAGDTLPGFAVREARAPAHLDLRGGHRFSRYALVFDLDEVAPGRTRLRARTWAAFPGLHGRLYRALVIDSRAHRFAVRRLLRRVAGAVSG